MSRGKFRRRSEARRSAAAAIADARSSAPAIAAPSETGADLDVADDGPGTADGPSVSAAVVTETEELAFGAAASTSGATARDPRLGAFPHVGSFMSRALRRHGFGAADVRALAGIAAKAKPAELLAYPGGLDRLDQVLAAHAAARKVRNDD